MCNIQSISDDNTFAGLPVTGLDGPDTPADVADTQNT